MIWRKVFVTLGIVAALCSLVPILLMDYWFIRVFDFMHMQLTALTLLTILLYLFVFKWRDWLDYAFLILLCLCFGYQVLTIFEYTPLSQHEMLDAPEGTDQTIHFMIANVLQKNPDYQKTIEHTLEENPDIAVFLETDQEWVNSLSESLASEYAHSIKVPLDNTYGMVLFSKLSIADQSVKYLVDDRIPSIHARVNWKNGQSIKLFAIHPTPPMPQHNSMSTDRDVEMMKTAFLARRSTDPTVVLGDFNDVPWSDTSELTRYIAELHDPRSGRGVFNSFKSGNYLMRWPLDQLFASEEFRYVDSYVLGKLGSDHDYYHVKLAFHPELASEQKPDKPTEKEIEAAREQMESNGYKDFFKDVEESVPDIDKALPEIN